MALYNQTGGAPQVLITSSERPQKKLKRFMKELKLTLPQSSIRWRPPSSVKDLIKAANRRRYSDLVIINEDNKRISKLLHTYF